MIVVFFCLISTQRSFLLDDVEDVSRSNYIFCLSTWI